ncbi:hypothetical protein [Sinorhizobium sp. BG8]|uniref:hypothetical protein n=1 Tax=Sinorhizobium sp. BG8 TaxID=2613773 RepID=UPI00193DF326|nr:hypothetical protein [Sinorhizobium sp. BG8]QRM53400.1 2-C-methyl-D-erythritol 2,4-cyclodiphosphate synthase [Sinorhizobium sp. BG8]
MSSKIYRQSIGPQDLRMVREILQRAGYITSNMDAGQGPHRKAALMLIRRFKSASLDIETTRLSRQEPPPVPDSGAERSASRMNARP